MKVYLVAVIITFHCTFGYAQTFRIDSLPTQGILLDKGWKWHAGDNPDYAKVDFDDAGWEGIDPTKDIFELLQLDFDFKTDLNPNLPKIAVIPQDIGRVLLNLINNAFYAVRNFEKPLGTLSTEKSDNQIIIKVIDNGTGMSEATKAKIFQPFFTSKPTGQGTGLGLSLAYDIIKAHGGEIKVETKEGEFAEFIIQL